VKKANQDWARETLLTFQTPEATAIKTALLLQFYFP
jgi:hypothetical protein